MILIALVTMAVGIANSYVLSNDCDPPLTPDSYECYISNKQVNLTDKATFDFSSILTQKFTITISNSVYSLVPPNSNVRFEINPNGSQVSVLNLTFLNSVIQSPDISLDTGSIDSGSSVTLQNSSLDTSMLIREGEGYRTNKAVFTGDCASEGASPDSITANMYGFPIPPSSITQGDAFTNPSFFGSGGKDPATFGGGRVYLRTGDLKLSSSTSFIHSNANLKAVLKEGADEFTGTGGMIIMALNTLSVPTGHPTRYFQCKGGDIAGTAPEDFTKWSIGGGGRVYLHIENPQSGSLDDLLPLFAVGSATSASPLYPKSQTGTIFLQTGNDSVLSVSAEFPPTSAKPSTCYTFLKFVGLNPPTALFRISINGTVNAGLVNTTYFPVQTDLQLTAGATLGMFVPDQTTGTNLTINSLLITGTSSNPQPTPSNLIPFGTFTVSALQSFKIATGSIILPVSPTVEYATQINIASPTVSMQNSEVRFSDPITTFKRPTTLFSITTDALSMDSTKAAADSILIVVTGDIHQTTVISNSELRSMMYYCTATSNKDPTEFFDSLSYLRGYNKDHQLETSIIESKKALLMIKNARPRTNENSDNTGMVNVFAPNIQLIRSNITDAGIIGFSTPGNLIVDGESKLDASASGCQPNEIMIGSINSKYLKICKVVGGSNDGRGSLGTNKNFDNCKTILTTSAREANSLVLNSGLGGQKSHQMDANDKFGYGGGIISLVGFSLDIAGTLNSTGGPNSIKDYTMIAGGSGGTISLTGNTIKISAAVSVAGGSSGTTSTDDDSKDLGFGGGGKVLINCTSWDTNPACITAGDSISFNSSSGDASSSITGPKYFVTMKMVQMSRPFLFDGNVYNTNYCQPGYGGYLCQKCPAGTYSSEYSTDPCKSCPCTAAEGANKIGMTSVRDCQCALKDSQSVSLLDILVILVILNAITGATYWILKSSKRKEDGNSNYLRYNLNDIRNTIGRIIVPGSNDFNDPWRFSEILHSMPRDLSSVFNQENMTRFLANLDQNSGWSKPQRLVCKVLKILNYSPFFLIFQRIFRSRRVSRCIKTINCQAEYDIFVIKDRKRMSLKWMVTSDKSKLFLDVVEVDDSEQKLMNWELPFPQKFIIFGNGSYNSPFKMEYRDPSLIKLIDHLKDIIENDSSYPELFSIPKYFLRSSKSTSQSGHFIEYFFGWLNVNLKTLSRHDPFRFYRRWRDVCNYLKLANELIMRPNGYQFKLRFLLSKEGKRRVKKKVTVPFDSPKEIDQLGNFFYSLIHYLKEGASYELIFSVEKLKVGGLKFSGNSDLPKTDLDFDDQNENLRNRHSEKFQFEQIRKKIKDNVIENQRELQVEEIDFEELELGFIGNKRRNNVLWSYISNGIPWFCYRHRATQSPSNYLLVMILFFMILELVSLSFT